MADASSSDDESVDDLTLPAQSQIHLLPTDSSTLHEIATNGKAWEIDKYKCLFRRVDPLDPHTLLCLPTGKQVHDQGGGHATSEADVSQMKKFLLAVDMYDPFDMQMEPMARGTLEAVVVPEVRTSPGG